LPLPENQQDELHSAIWRIVNSVQNPGDLNADGAVTLADYNAWRASYGDWQAGIDVNLDSKVDAADYTVWRDKRDALFALGAGQGVPEPCGVVLVAVALGSFAGVTRSRRA
jgi:hypothetical protein